MTRHQHLTDEQFYALLDEDKSVHLAGCAHCQQEFTAIQASLTGFREATISLAASLPTPEFTRQPLVAAAPARRFSLFSRTGLMASSATALVAIGVSFSGLMARHEVAPAIAPPAVVAQVDTTVSDEALLAGITQDLSTSVPPPLAPLDIPTTSTTK